MTDSRSLALQWDYVNRFRSTKEKNDIFQLTKEGKIEILIGTHALLNKT